MKKTLRIAVLLMSVVAGSVMAGAIHTWSSGETLTAADLNAALQHIHSLMVGGHGARLVDADVSSIAAIGSSKLAGYRMIPRAWGIIGKNALTGGALCAANPCTVTESQGVSSVGWSSTGLYTVTLNYTPTDNDFAVVVTMGEAGGLDYGFCFVQSTQSAAPQIYIKCRKYDGTALDSAPSFVVFDSN